MKEGVHMTKSTKEEKILIIDDEVEILNSKL